MYIWIQHSMECNFSFPMVTNFHISSVFFDYSSKNFEDLVRKWLLGEVYFPDESLQLRLFDDLIEGDIKLV